MSKVFYCDFHSHSPKDNIPNKIKKLFDIANFKELFSEDESVAIKLHFGEKGNTTYMHPVYVRQIVDKVKQYKAKPYLTDTNTLYSGSRTNSVDHIVTAIENGFSYSVVNAPIIIADGILSKNSISVPINKKHFEEVKIAGDIYNASSMIVLSHFKGHGMAGFGGSLKNLAMGCASAPGKQMQHSDINPVVNDECVGCTRCANTCPVKAITMDNKKAFINKDICYGCGECTTVCPVRAIEVNWDIDNVKFIEKMAEFAYGAVENKIGRVGYVNFVNNVTSLCDCAPWSSNKIANDIGIFFSTDPVALDKACYDAIIKNEGHDVFKDANPGTNGYRILEYASELGMGSLEYELIKIK